MKRLFVLLVLMIVMISAGSVSGCASSGSGIRLDDVFSAPENFRVNGSFSVFAGSAATDYVRIDNDTRINVRKGPGSDKERLGWAEVGSSYPYLGTVKSWHCIDYNGEIGYITGTLGEVVKNTVGNAQYVAITNSSSCNIRKKASSESSQIGKADPGDKFLYQGTENGWYKILFNGKTGYVSSKLSQLTDGPTEFSKGSSNAAGSNDKNHSSGKNTRKKCSKCHGTGGCHRCFGSGVGYGNVNGRQHACFSCSGSGRCFFCGGRGYTR